MSAQPSSLRWTRYRRIGGGVLGCLPSVVSAAQDEWIAAVPHWSIDALILAFAALVILRYRNRVRELAAAQSALKQRDERLNLALSASSDGYWDYDIAADCIYRSAIDRASGRVIERTLTAGEVRQRLHRDDSGKFEGALARHLSAQEHQIDVEVRLVDGERTRWILVRGGIVERTADGRPLRLAGTFRDTSEVRKAQRVGRIAEEVIESMQEAVAVTNANHEFVTVNPAFESMTGFDADEIAGQSAALLNSDRHDPEHYRGARKALEACGHWAGELWQRRRNGEERLLAVRTSRILLAPDNERLYVSVLSDITERRRNEHRLQRLASHDPLTGVANRNAFMQQLDAILPGLHVDEGNIGVLLIDLDRLKHVNETLGHDAGDELLQAVALRLEACLSTGDLLARLGSDEFVIAPIGERSSESLVWYAQFLISAFNEPFLVRGRPIAVTPSIGISVWPEHGADARHLVNAADSAMYESKAAGRNTFRFYSPARYQAIRERMELERRIRQAVEHNEFLLVYQPRFAVAAGRITGFEALLRWRHPQRGLVSPEEFIGVLEETGLVVPVGRWVLSEALAQVREWRQRHPDISVSVNVSQRQLQEGTLHQFIAILLNELGLNGNALELEITESQLMDDPDDAIAQLEDLHRLGLRVAIDDFGTGYSSLAHLRKLPIDILKIDKAFVADLPGDADSGVIIETILGMARTLRLSVVAEGVENEAQARFLGNLGVTEIQGFWFSRPIPGENVLPLLDGRGPRHAFRTVNSNGS
jgi:diguanylate cyclase (GGDEF)-like protein/PAS domain S-box-containing protein